MLPTVLGKARCPCGAVGSSGLQWTSSSGPSAGPCLELWRGKCGLPLPAGCDLSLQTGGTWHMAHAKGLPPRHFHDAMGCAGFMDAATNTDTAFDLRLFHPSYTHSICPDTPVRKYSGLELQRRKPQLHVIGGLLHALRSTTQPSTTSQLIRGPARLPG